MASQQKIEQPSDALADRLARALYGRPATTSEKSAVASALAGEKRGLPFHQTYSFLLMQERS